MNLEHPNVQGGQPGSAGHLCHELASVGVEGKLPSGTREGVQFFVRKGLGVFRDGHGKQRCQTEGQLVERSRFLFFELACGVWRRCFADLDCVVARDNESAIILDLLHRDVGVHVVLQAGGFGHL